MTLVELSFIAIAFIGVFGVIGIAAVVTGRTPKAVTKRLNWKKNLDKKEIHSPTPNGAEPGRDVGDRRRSNRDTPPYPLRHAKF